MDFRDRSIVHFNVADFSVAVERISDPTLASKAVIIGHLGASRAVVYDMSDEAYKEGVQKGMPLRQALRRCRNATLLSPRFNLYQQAMLAFLKQVYSYTPLIEHGLEDGHIYLDITGTHRLFGPPIDVGWQIQKEVRSNLSLRPIWTLATSKLVAKVASRLVKPVGEYIVSAGEEADFLAPLPLTILPGMATSEQLICEEFNLTRIGQLAALTQDQLRVPFGKRAALLYNLTRGIDNSEVISADKREKSITFDHFFINDTNDEKEVQGAVALLAAKAGNHLRKSTITARRIGISLRYSDGGITTRQATRKQAADSDFILTELAMLALSRCWTRRTRLRSCSLICDLFCPVSKQLSLFSLQTKQEEKQTKLQHAMDQIRKKHGSSSVATGMQHRGSQKAA